MPSNPRSIFDHMHDVTSCPHPPSLNRWSEHSQKREWNPCVLEVTVHSISSFFFFHSSAPAVTQSMTEYEISSSQIIAESRKRIVTHSASEKNYWDKAA